MKILNFKLLILLFVSQLSFAQNVNDLLNKIAETNGAIDEKVRIDVSGLSVYELLTTIAEEHKLNVSVDPELNQAVISNFYDVSVRDILMFLMDKYEIDMSYSNNIISFRKKEKKKPKPKPKVKKTLDIKYSKATDYLSVKLRNDSLPAVTEKITELSGKNIVLDAVVKKNNVSAYLINKPFDQVLEMLAKSNAMQMNKDENGFYFLTKATNQNTNNNQSQNNRRNRNSNRKNRNSSSGEMEVKLQENGYLSVKASESPIIDIILEATEILGLNYFFYDKLGGETATLVVKDITFDELLTHLFKGKKYAFNKTQEIYSIGLQSTEGLRHTEFIQLEKRRLEEVLTTLPSDLVQDLEIKEFNELNGFLVSGSKRLIAELKVVIRKLDKVVPLIQIEVLIAQYQRTVDVQTGLQAILDKENGSAIQTGGTVFPTTDVRLNSKTINNLIDSFNGWGLVKIGKVTKDFYASLTALENNSIVKIESTPKIATLSGHEASVSIGETDYYFEQTNRLINTGVNDNVLQSGQWRPTEANLSVNIKPTVSKDEHITLEISVEQSSFLGRVGEGAPPGRTTQRFESLIRVKNDEMILLGGLDELNKENSGTGTPVLSRIPIIKWFFSGRSKRNEKSKLHVFIKPTLVY